MSLPEATLTSMRATNDLFTSAVIGGRDLDALRGVYTPDASVLPPGSDLIQGLDAIRTFWHTTIHGLDIQSATLTTLSVEPAGDTDAVEIGRVDLTLASDVLVPAKYVVHWKQHDGAWKWHADIWNMNV